MQDLQVVQRERMLLDRDVVQARRARGVAPPRLPGGEEIEAEAEAGLEDDEALSAGPALRQTVALQKDVLRLPRAAGGAVVDVAERLRIGNAFLESQPGRKQRRGHPLKYHWRSLPEPAR